jgi:hypothetical protein
VPLAGHGLDGLGEAVAVDVADGGGDGPLLEKIVEVAVALSADADVRGDDPVVVGPLFLLPPSPRAGTKYGAAIAAAPAARNERRDNLARDMVTLPTAGGRGAEWILP